MIKELYQGDSIELQCKIDEDIADWKIRCEIWDNGNSVKKATSNSGGSDDQIEITDAANGIFLVKVDKGETTDFSNSSIEIEVETSDGKVYTVYRDAVEFLEEQIEWETP